MFSYIFQIVKFKKAYLKALQRIPKFLTSRVYITIFSILSMSCVKEEIDSVKFAELHPTIAVPVLNTNMTLGDMVAIQGSELDITVDPDGFLRFIYFEEIVSGTAPDYITIPDQSFSEMAPGPVGTGFGFFNINLSDTTIFSFSNGEEIDQVIVKNGTLNISLSHSMQHDVAVTLTFPSAELSGTPLTRTYNMNYTGSSPVTANEAIDLSGYDIDLTDGGTADNSLQYTIAATVTEIGGNPGGGNLSLNATLQNLEYSYLEGYLGQFNVPFNQDTVQIDIFDNSSFGNIFFEDPEARFHFENSFGVPLEAVIDTLVGVLNDGTPTTIVGTYDDNPVSVNAPSIAQVGQTVETDFAINTGNSNIQAIFNPTPNQMYYQVNVTANPAGPATNFVTDTSTIRITGEAEIPMDGRILTYALSDTATAVEIPDTADIEGWDTLNQVVFRFKTVNGFPIDARVQAYFIDVNDVVLDSVFVDNENFVESANIDGSGRVTSATTKFLETTFDQDRYVGVLETDKIVVIGTLQTINGGTTSVKLYTDYFLNIKMGVRVDGTIDLNDL